MASLTFDDATLADAQRFNRRLARMPRFRIRNRVTPLLLQSLLRASQLGGERLVKRRRLMVATRIAEADGVRVPVRVLRPMGPVRGVVLDIHGGGWAVGNARMDDARNAGVIASCDVATVSVDYRLAGRASIEELMDDCLAAARWLLKGGVPELHGLPVIIVGESAGGHLAAATLLRLKAWPELLKQIVGAVLYYGVYDLAGTPSVRSAGPETLVLDGPGMLPAMRMLTPGMSDSDRRVAPLSPLYGDLDGLPPALMVAGSIDPLRDDTTAMAKRWSEAAEVEVHIIPDAPHGFVQFNTRMAKQVLAHASAWIAARLESARAEQ